MPSSVNNASRPQVRKASGKPGTATSRAETQQQLNRRAARAARRAAERRRRNQLLSFAATGLVVLLAVLLFHDRLPGFANGSQAAHKTAYNCPAPTATPIGPAPVGTPAAHPPTLPSDAKEQTQQVAYTDANGAAQTSTLKYVVVSQGCGPTTKAGDTVTVTYTGWTQADGKEFDSSLSHSPYTFQVSGLGSATPNVIQGWNYGLIGMKPGETRRLVIPPALGYGAQGSPPTIPANATLIFDIKLISIDASS
jgi:FKBP-type peptidyl-prolyl cis-trans isomerase